MIFGSFMVMTLKKRDLDYEEHEALTPKDFIKKKLEVTIIGKPRIVKTKFRDEQPVIVVEFGIQKRTWWANWTSMNAMIDAFGSDEENHLGKTVRLEIIKDNFDGVDHDSIYVEGSKKED